MDKEKQDKWIKQLDDWANSLLDISKKNNLINFKNTKKSTLDILLPSPEKIFETLKRDEKIELFNPYLIKNNKDLEIIHKESGDKKDLLLDYFRKIDNKNKILISHPSTDDPYKVARKIDKETREMMDKKGVNVTYMAFGFIQWRESDNSREVFSAPILLVPIKIKQSSAIDPYYINLVEDEFVVNPNFSHKLEQEYGFSLPDYNNESLIDYIDKVEDKIKNLQWKIELNCKIAIFSFQKINMYRDLKESRDNILNHKNILKILGEKRNNNSNNKSDDSKPIENPIIDLYSVFDADSSQIKAIEWAKSGRSFVLQGPPGTGKSQTISNIIAECMKDNKKVLFVSEKVGALNVVYEKLKQAGLGDFCLQLHSDKAEKKDFINDIYNNILELEINEDYSQFEEEIEIKRKKQKELDDYKDELHKKHPVIEKSLYQLYQAYSKIHSIVDIDYFIHDISNKNEAILNDIISLLEKYVKYVEYIGHDYTKNPWHGYINQSNSIQERKAVEDNISYVVSLLKKSISLKNYVFKKYKIECNNLSEIINLLELIEFLKNSKLITPALLKDDNFKKVKIGLDKIKRNNEEFYELKESIEKYFDAKIYEINEGYYNTRLTTDFSNKFFRIFSKIFNSEYKEIINNLNLCKKDKKKITYEEAIKITEKLIDFRKKEKEYNNIEFQIKKFMGEIYKGRDSNWNKINEELSDIEKFLSKKRNNEICFGDLENLDNFSSVIMMFEEYNKIINYLEYVGKDAVNNVGEYFDNLLVKNDSLEYVLKRLEKCLEEKDNIVNYCHFKKIIDELTDKQLKSYIDAIIDNKIEGEHIINLFKKIFYYQWIDFIISNSEIFSSFHGISHDATVKDFCEKDRKQFEINQIKLKKQLLSKRNLLKDDMKYQDSYRVFYAEAKAKRQKNIRSLLSANREFIQKIKPCFLMSPLSVSTFLESVTMFDVLIFDEASQIFPQDAIGSIYRANQMIVVGDSKQMPPTDFFINNNDINDDEEEEEDTKDFESILDLCLISMKEIQLRWHYRSRYEELIAFSNKNFYDNNLITFSSPIADKNGIGVDYSYVEDGIFNNGENQNEAKFVVDLIYKHIDKYPNRSLGVVAFNKKQSDLIEEMLYQKRRNHYDQEKEAFFENSHEPFFIKNLESVQGDERDTIILSTVYARNAHGIFRQNFGPLNKMGGERRLNVAITRAKENVQVVSSMRYTDLNLQKSPGEGVRLLREYLDYAENGKDILKRPSVNNYGDKFDSYFELEVCSFLRSQGFYADTQVGCSGYRIDIGLKYEENSDYVLAIECDGATYHSSKNARDRDRLRQENLERMGWKFYRIWSTDWFKNKTYAQKCLIEAANKAIENYRKN